MEHQAIDIDESDREHQAIDIDESDRVEKLNEDKKGKGAISLPNRESSNEIREAVYKDDALEGRSTQEPIEQLSGSWSYHEDEDSDGMESQQQQDQAHVEREASIEYSLNLIERGLEEWRQLAREEGKTSSICIFRLPHGLVGTSRKAEEPELVSIGPYHRGKDHLLKFEEHKWYFLDKLLSRSYNYNQYMNISTCLRQMKDLEDRVRACYSDIVLMSSHDFVEMMLLDACFVIGLIRHLGSSEDSVGEDDPIFTKPWIIPILIRDLLKLENQLPFFVLERLFIMSWTSEDKPDSLAVLALKVFDLLFPMPTEIFFKCKVNETLHLLHLFYSSLLPSNPETKSKHLDGYRSSSQSIQCATQLRPSGIKFKPRRAESFLDIKFQNRALEIPVITVNDFTSTLLLNCVAWEQCQEDKPRYFTDYISFMSCLINQPRDVALLCLDGIITRFSQDDNYVADLFNNLGKNVVMNVHNCYLFQEFKELDAYFNSHWATMMRTYFRSPWSFISVFSAFIIILLSFIQTIMAVLSYQRQFG